MTLKQIVNLTKNKPVTRFTKQIKLADGAKTTVHVVKYDRTRYTPKIVAFPELTVLAEWCAKNEVSEAMGGGFFDRQNRRPLGECWVKGVAQNTSRFEEKWHSKRGCIVFDGPDSIYITPRGQLPQLTKESMLQAGPILVKNGKIKDYTYEGFTEGSHQFDSDIANGRYPRSAIGYNDKYIWSVICDGYTQRDSGLTFDELAQYLLSLGITNALNLDGGGSSTQISQGALRNRPCTAMHSYPLGRDIYIAIIFEEK